MFAKLALILALAATGSHRITPSPVPVVVLQVDGITKGIGGALWTGRVIEYVVQVGEKEAERIRTENIRIPTRVVTPRVGSGAHSETFWRGVSQCEQGGKNNPSWGYLSIMDPRAGTLSWGEQVAWANRIIAKNGDGAWAAKCVQAGYRASPGG